VPAIAVFIPPSVIAVPATLPLCAQLITRARIGLSALETMAGNSWSSLCRRAQCALAIVVVGVSEAARTVKHKEGSQRGCSERRSPETGIVPTILHRDCILRDRDRF